VNFYFNLSERIIDSFDGRLQVFAAMDQTAKWPGKELDAAAIKRFQKIMKAGIKPARTCRD